MLEIRRKPQPAHDSPSQPLRAQENAQANKYTPEGSSPQKRLPPFTSIDGSRNYRTMYRTACDFHERHNPPVIDIDYWREHDPEEAEAPQAEIDYWEKVVDDMTGRGKEDPFCIALLVAVFEELERQYYQTRKQAYTLGK